jgi:hypothetical protein
MVFSLFPTFFISASLLCNAIAHLELTRTSAKHLVLRDDDRCSPGTYSKTQGKPPCYDCLAEHTQTVTLSSFMSPSKPKPSAEFGVLSCIAARARYYVPTSRATTEMACQQVHILPQLVRLLVPHVHRDTNVLVARSPRLSAVPREDIQQAG